MNWEWPEKSKYLKKKIAVKHRRLFKLQYKRGWLKSWWKMGTYRYWSGRYEENRKYSQQIIWGLQQYQLPKLVLINPSFEFKQFYKLSLSQINQIVFLVWKIKWSECKEFEKNRVIFPTSNFINEEPMNKQQ